jgi:hypothetical protein
MMMPVMIVRLVMVFVRRGMGRRTGMMVFVSHDQVLMSPESASHGDPHALLTG